MDENVEKNVISTPTSNEPLRVLLLEDSALDAELIEAQLGELEFELTRVEGRDDFGAALANSRFNLILSDYNIPGFDGGTALSTALRVSPDVPFIFVSGALGDEKAIELLKRGATDYVLKDRLERLVPSVQRALAEFREKAERRRAERMLRERERTLSTLMANLPGMAFRCSPDAPWPFEFASEGCMSLTGWRPEEFYAGGALTWASIMHPADAERVGREAEAAFTARQQLTVTYRIRTKTGDEKWVWDRSIAQYTSDGTIEAIEGFVSDITQQRRNVEFEQQLIGIVSHDLRNPLNTIYLGTGSLLAREGLDEKTTVVARRMMGAAERANRMIRDLLDYTQARLGGGIPIEVKALDMHEHVLSITEELLHSHADRELRLHHEGDTRGEWDPDRVAQIVTNLVGNAFKYSPAGTPVTVRSRGEGNDVVLEVHNEGAPIAAERLSELFKPLSRGTPRMDVQTRSIGLGLYIVESIARAHGGDVDASSSAEGGTTFRVRMPRTATEGAHIPPSSTAT